MDCRKELSPVSPHPIMPPVQTVYGSCSGFIYAVIPNDTLFADSARIVIDYGRIIYTDNIGRFSTGSLSVGTHHLTVTHERFSQLDSVILIADSSVMFLPIKLSVGDYLPLALGNRWMYTYVYDQMAPPINRRDRWDATFTWEITSMISSESSKSWEVSELSSSRHIIVWGDGQPVDTTYSDTSGSFFFIEDKIHRITVEAGKGSLVLRPDLSGGVFYRYNKRVSDSSEIVIVDTTVMSYHRWSHARVSLGMSSYGWLYYTGGNYGQSASVTFVSASFAP